MVVSHHSRTTKLKATLSSRLAPWSHCTTSSLPYPRSLLLSVPPQSAVAKIFVQHDRDAQDPLGAVGRDDVGGGHGRAQVLPLNGPRPGDEVGAI